MQLKPGMRFQSQVCETEVVVVKTTGAGSLSCGGAPMAPKDGPMDAGAALDPGQAGGTLMGKRYIDAEGASEFLCVKPGSGSLALDGQVLVLKTAKALPASD